LLLCNEDNLQPGAASIAIARLNRAAVLVDDTLSDRQAESGSARIETARYERIKYVRQHIRRYAGAIIFYGDGPSPVPV
jgi:hypothetical protein